MFLKFFVFVLLSLSVFLLVIQKSEICWDRVTLDFLDFFIYLFKQFLNLKSKLEVLLFWQKQPFFSIVRYFCLKFKFILQDRNLFMHFTYLFGPWNFAVASYFEGSFSFSCQKVSFLLDQFLNFYAFRLFVWWNSEKGAFWVKNISVQTHLWAIINILSNRKGYAFHRRTRLLLTASLCV